MNDRFQNLIRQRHTKLAWGLLGLLCLVMLVVDRFAYRVIGFSEIQWIYFAMIGLVAAQFILLAIWATLGDGSLVRRLLFLICAFVAMTSAWLLGLATSFGDDLVALHRREEVLLLGVVPVLFLSLCVPLIVLRCFFSRQLAVSDAPIKEPVTSLSLMLFTAVVAICIASAQVLLQVRGADSTSLWITIGICSGVSFLMGLAVVLPIAVLLISPRKGFGLWTGLLVIYLMLLTVFVSYGLSLIPGSGIRFPDGELFLGQAQIDGSAMLAVVIGIGIIRLFGYRLHKAIRQTS